MPEAMQDSPRAHTPSARLIHSSVNVVVSLQAYREALHLGESQRDAARASGMARSTVGDLDRLSARTGTNVERDAHVRTPEGLAHLQQIIDAALFVFCIVAGVGLPTFRRFLELAGLTPFVASSYGAMQARLSALESAYVKECDAERALQAAQMEAPAPVVVGLDETFFGSRTCLVAGDLLTGFLLIETFAESRDRASWNAAWVAATAGMPLAVTHAVSDGARGIQAFVEDDLGVARAPDLFHVMHDIGKAFACHLARLQRRAQEREEEARDVYVDLGEFEVRVREQTRRGRPFDVKGRKAQARGYIASAAREVLVAKERREEFRRLLAALGAAYFPVSLMTGEVKTADALRSELEEIFAYLHDLEKSSRLGEHHAAYLRKAECCIPEMVAALELFHAQVNDEIKAASLASGEAEVLARDLLPAALLEERRRNAKTVEERNALRERSEELLGRAADALDSDVTAQSFQVLLRIAVSLAALWQRTTSSIEGRNGTLSQRHHARRGLSDRKLQCATCVHNFFIRRSDGTTAAERFFGRGHRDVAKAALNSMGDLKRPRHSRQAA